MLGDFFEYLTSSNIHSWWILKISFRLIMGHLPNIGRRATSRSCAHAKSGETDWITLFSWSKISASPVIYSIFIYSLGSVYINNYDCYNTIDYCSIPIAKVYIYIIVIITMLYLYIEFILSWKWLVPIISTSYNHKNGSSQ